MAYVEEEISEEPIQVPLESLLYMVPDAHDNPNTSITATNPVKSMEDTPFIV
jgi:hypothetical protein